MILILKALQVLVSIAPTVFLYHFAKIIQIQWSYQQQPRTQGLWSEGKGAKTLAGAGHVAPRF